MELHYADVENLVSEGLSTRALAKALECSVGKVRVFLARHSLKTLPKQIRKRDWSEADLTAAVASSLSKSEVLKQLGLTSISSGNYENISRYIRKLGLDTTHFKGRAHQPRRPKIPDDLIFTQNSDVMRKVVRNRVIANALKPYICQLCDSPPIWKGRPLTLRLDHINGVSNDHRLENLRFVCPNCDSQLDTYCGKNLKTRACSKAGDRDSKSP